MTFDEALEIVKSELLPHVADDTIVSASNRYERIRIEQRDSENKLSIWTEYSPRLYEALKITGPMKK